MKFIAYLFCFYLFALTTLPSVRALKMQLYESCQSSCQNNDSNSGEPSACEKGKIIMNLSFNPIDFVLSQPFLATKNTIGIEIEKKENCTYKKVFISQYNSAIWQPPKIFSLV